MVSLVVMMWMTMTTRCDTGRKRTESDYAGELHLPMRRCDKRSKEAFETCKGCTATVRKVGRL